MIKRVAVVTESFLPQINGVTGSVTRILETFRQRGIAAEVFAPTRPSPKYLGYPVHQMPSLPLLQFAVGVPNPWLAGSLEQFRPDLVHVAAPFLLGSQALGWAERNSVPSVAVYQTDVAGYLARYNLAFAKPVMERLLVSIHEAASLTLAPTPKTKGYLQSIGVPRVELWGRGVDLDLFDPAKLAAADLEQWKSASARPLIGFVGRLAPEKQVHRLSELLGLDADFLVVGDGPERAKLEQQFGSRVRFAGSLVGLELAAAYAAMDVFVHFGTEETFGQTIQEAHASGLAVVGPNSGGVAELVSDQVDGLLVDHANPGAYRDAVALLLGKPDMRKAMGLAGRAKVASKSWESNNEQLLSHYATTVRSGQEIRLELA